MTYECRECHQQVEAGRFTNKPEDRGLCHGCDFWTSYTKRAALPASVRCGGEHYWIGQENGAGDFGFRGFGGRKFRIRFHDGREVKTSNLWFQGDIPEHFRARLPDNATLEDGEEPIRATP